MLRCSRETSEQSWQGNVPLVLAVGLQTIPKQHCFCFRYFYKELTVSYVLVLSVVMFLLLISVLPSVL